MTTKDAMAKAAQLFAEWVEGDGFEYEGTTPGKYYDCPATDVVRWLFGDVAVRIKPRAKKVLRPAWEILRDNHTGVRVMEDLVSIYVDGLGHVWFGALVANQGVKREDLNSQWPESWFTTEEPKR